MKQRSSVVHKGSKRPTARKPLPVFKSRPTLPLVSTPSTHTKVNKQLKSKHTIKSDVYEADDHARDEPRSLDINSRGNRLDDVETYELDEDAEIACDDDEEVTEDKALNEAKYLDLFTPGRSHYMSPGVKKHGSSNRKQEVKYKPRDLNKEQEVGPASGDEEQDNYDCEDGSDVMPISDMLNDDAETRNNSSNRKSTESQTFGIPAPKIYELLPNKDGYVTDESDEAYKELDKDMARVNKEDEDATANLMSHASSLTPKRAAAPTEDGEARKKRKRNSKLVTVLYEKSEFNLRTPSYLKTTQVELSDLSAPLEDTTECGSLKRQIAELESDGKDTQPFAAPLPKCRQNEHGQAAHGEARAEVSKWQTVVNASQQADILSLPMNDHSGFYCLEEIDGVDVVYEDAGDGNGGKVLKFKVSKPLDAGNPAVPVEPLNVDVQDGFMSVDDFKEADENEAEAKEIQKAGDKSRTIEDGGEEAFSVDDNDEDAVDDKASKHVGVELSPEGVNMAAWGAVLLATPLLRGLQDLKFDTPTEIQGKVLPIALNSDRDVIGAAETGSGKTLAFGLPILQSIITTTPSIIHKRDTNATLTALILTPTRELALQVAKHLKTVSHHTCINTVALVGGMSTFKQQRMLKSKPHILVATPGRLWELSATDESILNRLRHVKFLVLDEADRMLEAGHFRDLEHILRALSSTRKVRNDPEFIETLQQYDDSISVNTSDTKGTPRRTFVFSATLIADARLKRKLKRSNKVTAVSEGPSMEKLLARLEFRDPQPEYVNVVKTLVAGKIFEARIDCLFTEKDAYLYYLLIRYPGRTLVFVNSIDAIRRLVPIFTLLNVPNVLAFHSAMQQRQRLKNLDRFITNPKSVLIASDVAARGLDIPNVEHVVHYQLPRTAELYIHRSGRTARGNTKDGISVVLCSPDEVGVYRRICRLLGKDNMGLFPVDRTLMRDIDRRLALVKHINDEEHRLDKSEHEKKWLQKAADEAGIDINDGNLSPDSDDEVRPQHGTTMSKKQRTIARGRLRNLRHELQHMLSQPILPMGVSGRYLTSGIVDGLPEVLMKTEGTDTLMPTFLPSRAVEDAKRGRTKKATKFNNRD
ncbi:hypothetical protein SeMB42_g07626 [Synchytrium endobioticum]|uniref:ATP-dependent RNA helicase n=1 Tax=Synchytrium endobioticum TaxID=286115 RepID=A0A507CJN3_9FUNG|nr:hypothetical protein SeMB42_g07626 [Synchytrium endobioticum]TPX39729.1 hypothetical protein SeLEV6574_g07017 [Synchytrium endobioticum]